MGESNYGRERRSYEAGRKDGREEATNLFSFGARNTSDMDQKAYWDGHRAGVRDHFSRKK